MDAPVEQILVQPWEELPQDQRELWHKRITKIALPPLLTDVGADSFSLESFDPRQLSAKVSQDAVLGGKLLAVANSAKFGLTQSLTSIQRAVVHLGFNLVKTIMVAYQLENTFEGLADLPKELMTYVRRLSTGASIIAHHWGHAADLDDASTAATAALLCRLGTLVLWIGNPTPPVLYRPQPDEISRLIFENETWNITTPTLSSVLIAHWGLPEPLPVIVGRRWEPLVYDLEAWPNNRMITLIAASDVLSQKYLAHPSSTPGEVFEAEAYATLKANLVKQGLVDALRNLWLSPRLQRELASATVA
ncbi:MAG: HDOD domain-containing protein [Planctomycetes bacterium]|nr:HDOD domain-containing protein [Planctomycetota bacterium]